MVSINRMASAPRFPQNRGAFPNRAEKSGPRETRALPADRKKACASARRTADNRFAYDGKGGCPCQDTHGSTDQFQVHSPSIRRGIKQQFGANIAFQTNIPNKKQPIRLKHCYLLHFFFDFFTTIGEKSALLSSTTKNPLRRHYLHKGIKAHFLSICRFVRTRPRRRSSSSTSTPSRASATTEAATVLLRRPRPRASTRASTAPRVMRTTCTTAPIRATHVWRPTS